MIAIFIGAAVAALFFLIAAVLLGGWWPIAGLGVCLLVMAVIERYEEHKKDKARKRAAKMGCGFHPAVWGA